MANGSFGEQFIDNTIVIQPVSILGKGLQSKEDPGFLSSTVTSLCEDKSYGIWQPRDLCYLPIRTLEEVLVGLLCVPQSELNEKMTIIPLPGNKISQWDAYQRYILPITQKIMGNSTMGTNIFQEPNRHVAEEANRTVDVSKIHRLIVHTHKVGENLLPELFTDIIKDIVLKKDPDRTKHSN